MDNRHEPPFHSTDNSPEPKVQILHELFKLKKLQHAAAQVISTVRSGAFGLDLTPITHARAERLLEEFLASRLVAPTQDRPGDQGVAPSTGLRLDSPPQDDSPQQDILRRTITAAMQVKGAINGASSATVMVLAEMNKVLVGVLEEEVQRLRELKSGISKETSTRLGGVNQVLGRLLEDEAGPLRALNAASNATMTQLAAVHRQLGKLLDDEIGRLVKRFDRELLSLHKRPGTGHAAPPAVMVQGHDGATRRLSYGESIPELLYGKVQGAEVFNAPMKVALNVDASGDIFLSTLSDGGYGIDEAALPLSSDVLWLRQMAAYGGKGVGEAPPDPPPRVRVAAVTIPINEHGDILITQRAFRGIYDGMWVFPGGHVDGGEGLLAAGVREVMEETGITVDPASLKPLAVWEGTVTSRHRQFCVVFFAADATCGNALLCTMELQVKEVLRHSLSQTICSLLRPAHSRLHSPPPPLPRCVSHAHARAAQMLFCSMFSHRRLLPRAGSPGGVGSTGAGTAHSRYARTA